MNRREFIARSSAAFTSVVLGNLTARTALGADCDPPLGLQLFTIRDELERDPHAALARLRDMGLTQAELCGLSGRENGRLFGLTAAELKSAFAANALSVELAHVDGSLTNTAAIADFAAELGITTAIVALPAEFTTLRDGRFSMVPAEGRAQLDALAEKLDRTARDYRRRGIRFGYHNHNVELVPVDGVVPLDYLLTRTDPDLVKMELDLGWLALAGANPAEYVRRYAGRVIACHMKDYDARIASDVLAQKLVEPGAGAIDFFAPLTIKVSQRARLGRLFESRQTLRRGRAAALHGQRVDPPVTGSVRCRKHYLGEIREVHSTPLHSRGRSKPCNLVRRACQRAAGR